MFLFAPLLHLKMFDVVDLQNLPASVGHIVAIALRSKNYS